MAFLPIYILILAGTIVIDYYAGIWLEKEKDAKRKKMLLLLSIFANVGCLAVFKYYNFINENISNLLGIFHIENEIPMLKILLPIGLSFHTFQAMSYTFEVYRGNQKAEHHFGIYALYVMYYPQLVAGPIERPQNVLHQLKREVVFDYDGILKGLRWMLWGLFIKVVIADRLAIYVDTVFENPSHHSALSSIVAMLFFTFQIYGDFCGYSFIAIGCAKVLGVDLMVNFRRPYMSTSIREFWSRWHISLSTWFRDYLYIPLGGSRVSFLRNLLNVFIVFMVSGLWHGANWTFVIWGALHGGFIIVETILGKGKFGFSLPSWMKWCITFALANIAWVFFRAKDITTANTLLSNIFTFKKGNLYVGNASGLVFGFGLIIFLLLSDFLIEKYGEKFALLQHPKTEVRWLSYTVLLALLLLIGVFNGGQFIYFQF